MQKVTKLEESRFVVRILLPHDVNDLIVDFRCKIEVRLFLGLGPGPVRLDRRITI
jgi:hypothetical protein